VSLAALSETDVAAVARAVAVLEQVHGVIDAAMLPVLSHPDLRPVVDAELDAVGRVVVEVHRPNGRVEGYSSGYADDVAERLAAEGLGILTPIDRSVVALVLLRCVAMPTAQGWPPHRWSAAPPVSLARLHDNRRLGKAIVRDAVNRLHDLHVLVNGRAVGIRPGPAFDRLTPAQRQRIEEDLFVLAAPSDPVAAVLQRRHREHGQQ
jgi:hypothetical protein